MHCAFFTNVVETLKNSPPKYYLQFKVATQNVRPRSSTNVEEYVQKSTRESENIREHMIEDFLKRPTSFILAKVFQQLILDSVCDVFKLTK